MKKKLLVLLLLFSMTVYGQNYYPLPDSNAVWNIDHQIDCNASPAKTYGTIYSVVIKGDTVVGGNTYKKLVTPYLLLGYDFFCNPNPTPQRNVLRGLIRQDKAAKKVYIWTGTNEQLLYDFNLKTGDTLKGYLGVIGNNVVQHVDSVTVDGAYRKRWKVGQGNNYFIVEGVGSDGLVEKIHPITSYYFRTFCLKVNGKNIYNAAGAADCELVTGIFESKKGTDQLSIFPNPSNGSFTLNSTEQLKEIIVSDLMGKVVLKQQLNNSLTHQFNDLSKGTYILTISDKNDQLTYHKIIVCN